MNRAVRDEWVRRLRSGDYAQGVGALFRPPSPGDATSSSDADGPDGPTVPGEFCCLGVLCEVARELGLLYRSDVGLGYRSVDGSSTTWWNGVLPDAVVAWAELPGGGNDPEVDDHPLSHYNDGHGGVRRRDFTELARLIEENL